MTGKSATTNCYVAIDEHPAIERNRWYKVKWQAGGREEYGEALSSTSDSWFKRISSRVTDSMPCARPSHVWLESST